MLLIDIRELDLILTHAVRFRALKHQVHHVRRILGFQGEDVVVLSGAEDFCERDEVDAQSDVAVASVGGEAFCFEDHGDQRDVRVVHGLEGDAGVVAVEVAVLDEVFDCVDDLVGNSCEIIRRMQMLWYISSVRTFFSWLACSRRASNTIYLSASSFSS